MPRKKPQKATKTTTKKPQQATIPETKPDPVIIPQDQQNESVQPTSSSDESLSKYAQAFMTDQPKSPEEAAKELPAPGASSPLPTEADELTKSIAGLASDVMFGIASAVNSWRKKDTKDPTSKQRDTMQRGWEIMIGKAMPNWLMQYPEYVMIGLSFAWVIVGNAVDRPDAEPQPENVPPAKAAPDVSEVEVNT